MLGLTEDQEAVIRQSRSHGAALRIMEFAQRSGGATVEEFLDGLNIRAASFHPRLYELMRTGCVHVDGRRKNKTGHTARVYKTSKGATFAQYLELRKVILAKQTVRGDLTDVERAMLAVGMETLDAWQGNERQRRNAIIKLVDRLNKITKLVTQRKGDIDEANSEL